MRPGGIITAGGDVSVGEKRYVETVVVMKIERSALTDLCGSTETSMERNEIVEYEKTVVLFFTSFDKDEPSLSFSLYICIYIYLSLSLMQ